LVRQSILRSGLVTHAPESKVITSATNFPFPPTASDITFAILFVAKKGSTALHTFYRSRFHGIVAIRRTCWIFRRTAFIIIRAVVVRTPFPHIAIHIIQAPWIGLIGLHGGRAFIPIFSFILYRETSLVYVGHPLTPGLELVAPIILGVRIPGSCGIFP